MRWCKPKNCRMHADTHLTTQEAFELVVREMRMHAESGRKNFALRVPPGYGGLSVLRCVEAVRAFDGSA